jgi:hypothetical protein
MFPNVRLQIAALFVSVVALSFGFGVFAAFRVNHEPLGQLPASGPPLQLAAENTAPSNTTTSWGAPFGSRFWLSETQIHGAANLPPLTPVVRHEITERTITWIVVTGGVAGAPAPQVPPALSGVQAVVAPLASKQGGATEESPAPAVAPAAAVVGAAEPAAPVQSEVTNSVPEDTAQERKAPRKVSASASRKTISASRPRRHVAARVSVRPPMRLQPAAQREEPVVFQTAPPPYQSQKGTPVAGRSGRQNSTLDVPVFQTAPPSQH